MVLKLNEPYGMFAITLVTELRLIWFVLVVLRRNFYKIVSTVNFPELLEQSGLPPFD